MGSASDRAPAEVGASTGPQDLPDNVLQEILSHLTFRERVRVAPLVCRQWLRVLRQPSPMWRDICYCVTNLGRHAAHVSAAQQAASFLIWLQPRRAAVRSLACCSCLRVDEPTARLVAQMLRLIGPNLASFEFDCYSTSYAADGLPTVFRALVHCTSLAAFSLKGEHCLRALAQADCLAGGWPNLATLSLRFKGPLPQLVWGWTTLRELRLTLADPETLKFRPNDDLQELALPQEVSRLTRLERLTVDFSDHPPGEHPGVSNHLIACPGLGALGTLRTLHLRHCALRGDSWPAAWDGLTGLTDLAFVNCLGASVGDQLQLVCAAGLPLLRLEVSDAHAAAPGASLVKGCPELSRLASLRELVCNNQRRSPHVAQLEHLTSLQVRNSVDMYPDYDEDVDPPGSFPPLVSRLYCGQWTNLGRLVRLDFSGSDDLTLVGMAWSGLRSLQTLLLNDIRRLVLSSSDDLADLAALPDLALVDMRGTVPGDACSMVQVLNLAMALRDCEGSSARFLVEP